MPFNELGDVKNKIDDDDPTGVEVVVALDLLHGEARDDVVVVRGRRRCRRKHRRQRVGGNGGIEDGRRGGDIALCGSDCLQMRRGADGGNAPLRKHMI